MTEDVRWGHDELAAELSAVEENRWLVDRERGGWQYATERLLKTRLADIATAAPTEITKAVEAHTRALLAFDVDKDQVPSDVEVPDDYVRGLCDAASGYGHILDDLRGSPASTAVRTSGWDGWWWAIDWLREYGGPEGGLLAEQMSTRHPRPAPEVETRADVVTLCGSTRFKTEFAQENQRLTLAGHVVLAPGMFGHSDMPDVDWSTDGSDVKRTLDALHFQKIRMADRVHVIDPGGYIGESTAREIEYAKSLGLPVTRLSEEAISDG